MNPWHNAYVWPTSDDFIEMVVTTSDDMAFLEMNTSLALAEKQVFDESITKMTALLEPPDVRTRNRVLSVFSVMQQKVPERLRPHVPSIVPELIPLLQDESDRIVGARIYGAILSKSATCERTRPGPAAEDRYSRRGW